MTGFTDMIDGYYRFRGNEWLTERERWAELATSQKPKVMVISCSDSRVDPATIFGARPGEIFVVRNVAALVPPYEPDDKRHGVSAAVEFAVTKLKVEEIVVLGHGACGGVNAALTQSLAKSEIGDGGFVKNWISMLDEAREKVVAKCGTGDEGQKALEQEGVRVSLANLMTFPFVKDRVDAGTLRLHGAVFAIADGKLRILGEGDRFEAA